MNRAGESVFTMPVASVATADTGRARLAATDVAAVRREHVTQAIRGTLTDGGIDVRVVQPGTPGLEGVETTACWIPLERKPDGSLKRATSDTSSDKTVHLILLGAAMHERLTDPAKAEQFAIAHYRHEHAHACWTTRDRASIDSELKSKAVPFSLYNWFEDARIEALERGESGQAFGWAGMERFPEVRDPLGVVAACVHYEGDLDRVRASATSVSRALQDHAITCYESAVAADGHVGVIAACAKFMAGLPPDDRDRARQSTPGGSGERQDDLATGDAIASDPKALAAALQCTGEMSPAQRHAKPPPRSYVPDNAVERTGAPLLAAPNAYATELDGNLVQAMAQRLDRAIPGNRGDDRTRSPRGKIDLDRFLAGKPDFYRDPDVGCRRSLLKLMLIVDCSGSMRGVGPTGRSAISSAAHVVGAWSQIARQGRVEGHVALSGMNPDHAHEVFRMPLTDDQLRRFRAFCPAEGIQPTIGKLAPLIQRSHLTGVITDGSITDAPIDKAWFSRVGVTAFGCYVGEDDVRGDLETHFPRVLVAPSEIALADQMAGLLLTTARRSGR